MRTKRNSNETPPERSEGATQVLKCKRNIGINGLLFVHEKFDKKNIERRVKLVDILLHMTLGTSGGPRVLMGNFLLSIFFFCENQPSPSLSREGTFDNGNCILEQDLPTRPGLSPEFTVSCRETNDHTSSTNISW